MLPNLWLIAHGQNKVEVENAHLHAVEADKVVQLFVFHDGQKEEKEDNEGHKLPAVVKGRQRSCKLLICLMNVQKSAFRTISPTYPTQLHGA